MDDQITDSFRRLARERSHQESRQSSDTNRMLIQTLALINGAAAISVLTYLGRHGAGSGKSAAILTIICYCLGVFSATFAGLFVRRTSQEWASYWEIQANPEGSPQSRAIDHHRHLAMKSKRWSTGLVLSSEAFFLVASLTLALSLS